MLLHLLLFALPPLPASALLWNILGLGCPCCNTCPPMAQTFFAPLARMQYPQFASPSFHWPHQYQLSPPPAAAYSQAYSTGAPSPPGPGPVFLSAPAQHSNPGPPGATPYIADQLLSLKSPQAMRNDVMETDAMSSLMNELFRHTFNMDPFHENPPTKMRIRTFKVKKIKLGKNHESVSHVFQPSFSQVRKENEDSSSTSKNGLGSFIPIQVGKQPENALGEPAEAPPNIRNKISNDIDSFKL